MLKYIYNIKNLNQKNKIVIKFKYNKTIINLTKLLVNNNLISYFTIKNNYIYISLKYNYLTNKNLLKTIKVFNKSNQINTLTYVKLLKLSSLHKKSIFILDTLEGMLDHKKALKLKIGGRLLLKLN